MGFSRARRLKDFILKNIGKVGERKFFIACTFLKTKKEQEKLNKIIYKDEIKCSAQNIFINAKNCLEIFVSSQLYRN